MKKTCKNVTVNICYGFTLSFICLDRITSFFSYRLVTIFASINCFCFFFVKTVNVHLIYGFRTLTMMFINCYCKAGDTHIVVLHILSIIN